MGTRLHGKVAIVTGGVSGIWGLSDKEWRSLADLSRLSEGVRHPRHCRGYPADWRDWR